jgi:predicted transcriptional regulator
MKAKLIYREKYIYADGLIREMGLLQVSKKLNRDYKNIHTDVRLLENIGLIERTEDNKVEVPWNVVEARLELAA